MVASRTPAEQFEWLKDSLENGGTGPLARPDNELLWVIFENFDGDVISCLHRSLLDHLVEHRLIDEDLRSRCLAIRELALPLLDQAPRTAEYVRSSPVWNEVRQLCDAARALVH